LALAQKHGAKMVHFMPLLELLSFILPVIQNQYLFFVVIIDMESHGYDGIPYLMVVANIPKERYGVYMGIINMMIVIPMIFQNVSFGFILKHFLNNDPRFITLLEFYCSLVQYVPYL
jgi:maltose/moltooligosaccharide transporter